MSPVNKEAILPLSDIDIFRQRHPELVQLQGEHYEKHSVTIFGWEFTMLIPPDARLTLIENLTETRGFRRIFMKIKLPGDRRRKELGQFVPFSPTHPTSRLEFFARAPISVDGEEKSKPGPEFSLSAGSHAGGTIVVKKDGRLEAQTHYSDDFLQTQRLVLEQLSRLAGEDDDLPPLL